MSQTYQDNLNVTINSLDAATRNKLLELQGLIDQVNQTLQQDIALASQAAKDVIRKASLEIRRATLELEQSLKNVIIVGGETAAYVVDRAIYDAILVIALVLLGVGLLVFILLLFLRRLPQGLARVFAARIHRHLPGPIWLTGAGATCAGICHDLHWNRSSSGWKRLQTNRAFWISFLTGSSSVTPGRWKSGETRYDLKTSPRRSKSLIALCQ